MVEYGIENPFVDGSSPFLGEFLECFLFLKLMRSRIMVVHWAHAPKARVQLLPSQPFDFYKTHENCWLTKKLLQKF